LLKLRDQYDFNYNRFFDVAMAASSSARTALVTGGSSGLGFAIAIHLARVGYTVVVTSRALASLERAFAEADPSVRASIKFAECDLSTVEGPAACASMALELLGGRLDVLVNNAGAGFLGQYVDAPELDVAKYDYTMALDVRAPMILTNLCASALVRSGGCIVNLSSIAAARPLPGAGAYCMAKAAIEMLTKVSALELAPKGVRVNCVAPATIETRFHENAGECRGRTVQGCFALKMIRHVGPGIALCRHVSRDCCIVLQGEHNDTPHRPRGCAR